MAIECRHDDTATQALTGVLHDAATARAVGAERAMNRALHGSCHVPVAALAREQGGELHLLGRVGDAATGRLVEAEARAPATAFESLGATVAERLLAAGAAALLAPHL